MASKNIKLYHAEPCFKSRFVTLKKSTSFCGGNYELVGWAKDDSGTMHTIKNSDGDYKDVEHNELMKAVTGYWK